MRTFEDRADALAHFFQRAGEAPRLIAYDDALLAFRNALKPDSTKTASQQ